MLRPLGTASLGSLRLLQARCQLPRPLVTVLGQPCWRGCSSSTATGPRDSGVVAAPAYSRREAPVSNDEPSTSDSRPSSVDYRQVRGGWRGRGSGAARGRGRAAGRGEGRGSYGGGGGRSSSSSSGSSSGSRYRSETSDASADTTERGQQSGSRYGREQAAPQQNGSSTPSRGGPSSSSGSSSSSAPLPHRRRAAERAAQAGLDAAPAPPQQQHQQQLDTQQNFAAEVPQATFVPRDPRTKDGPWTKLDAALVTDAQKDAAAAVVPTTVDADGYVLLGKSAEELRTFAESQGQPAYRGKQLLDGVLRGARSIADMPTVPKAWREQLQAAGVRTGRSILQHSVMAKDGTQKLLLQLADGRVIETVGIPVDDEQQSRLTVCVSSQVGCPMRCSFCATGKGGFARNLMPHEIIDQVLTVQEIFGKRVSNVVFMGMGEPLLNLPSVVTAYKYLNTQLGIGGRGITISTVGVPNAIRRLASHDLSATLAVSIHAPNQELREQLIPSAKVYPLWALMDDCVAYFQQTKRRVSYEYTLMAGVNDEPKHAQELADLLRSKDLASHINIIPWNPVDETDFRRPTSKRVAAFKEVLEAAGLPVSVRSTRGLDAAAACGQLRNMHQKTPMQSYQVPA